jgi:hypothetical protein
VYQKNKVSLVTVPTPLFKKAPVLPVLKDSDYLTVERPRATNSLKPLLSGFYPIDFAGKTKKSGKNRGL